MRRYVSLLNLWEVCIVPQNESYKDYARYAEHCLNVAHQLTDQELRRIHREMAAEWTGRCNSAPSQVLGKTPSQVRANTGGMRQAASDRVVLLDLRSKADGAFLLRSSADGGSSSGRQLKTPGLSQWGSSIRTETLLLLLTFSVSLLALLAGILRMLLYRDLVERQRDLVREVSIDLEDHAHSL